MVHVHGAQVQQLVTQTRGVPPERLLVVPVDVGKLAATSVQVTSPVRCWCAGLSWH